MNLTEWRTAVKEQAGRLRGRLSDLVHQTEQLAPGVIYGATAGLAVAPLVAAAQSGAVPYNELWALLGGAGVNILSNELYAWKQRSEEQLSEELPTRLGELAEANPDWRDLLDKLVQETQAASAAQAALGEAAGAYLAALQRDAQRLGSRIIVASVGGNARYVIIGDGSTINHTEIHHHSLLPPITFDDILRSYLAKERRICDELSLAKPKADAPRAPRMQRVFVELRTTAPVDETTWFNRLNVALNDLEKLRQQVQRQLGAETRQRRMGAELAMGKERAWFAELHRLDDKKLTPVARLLNVTPDQVRAARHPLTPLEAMRTARSHGRPSHLLLLGDPGGGKSTWVRRLTSVLAWDWLHAHRTPESALDPPGDDEIAWLRATQAGLGCTAGELIPLRIPMHRWASLARRGELKLTGQAADLVMICAQILKADHAVEGIPIYDHTLACLQHARAIILLDGLDEVTDDVQRRLMISAVRAFAAETVYRRTPLLVTCRSKPYARFAAAGQGMLAAAHLYTLGELDEDAIHLFIDRWYAEMTWAERGEPGKLLADARRLHDALPVRDDLRRMAGTPLLLTMMARTNQESGLPDGRAELYENLVQELLWEWQVRRSPAADDEAPQPDAADQRALLDILRAASPDLSQAHLSQVLDQLAYAVHTGGDEAVEIERETLERWMRRLLPAVPGDAKANAAATELAINVVNFIGQRSGLLVDIDDGQRFRFTHRTFQEYLAARWIATGSYGARLQKMQEKIDDVNWREAFFLSLGCLVSTVNKAYDDALLLIARLLQADPLATGHTPQWERDLLVCEAFVRQLKPEKLALATDALGRDQTLDRVARRLREAMQHRQRTPAQRLEAGLLLDDLRSLHGLTPDGLDDFILVPGADFAIGKYPVTNAQFRRFVEAGGYGEKGGQRPEWWSEAGWKRRKREDWTEPRYWDDRKWSRDTQPVVGVSWYEANAYCNWLNLTAKERQRKPEGMKAQLPTQAQWMLATRNGQPAPTKQEEDYPWRAPFDKALANTKESNLQQTTPVDMYLDGAPFGVFDLAGNVWEWTADASNKDRDRFWLKGGSWYDNSTETRSSAAGSRLVGWNGGDADGFRVVFVHVSHG